jgi:hypothetical protein
MLIVLDGRPLMVELLADTPGRKVRLPPALADVTVTTSTSAPTSSVMRSAVTSVPATVRTGVIAVLNP